MIPASHLWAFAATVVVIVVTPGPAVLFTVGRALTVGRRAALATVPGNASGVLVQAAAVAFGMGAIVEASALVYSVIKYVGAAYIVYLGIRALLHRRASEGAATADREPVSVFAAARDGFVVGVTNPKTIVFLATVVPGLAVPSAGNVPLQMLLLGAMFPAATLVFNTCWALAAGTARQWFARSARRVGVIERVGGVVLVGLGVDLALTGRAA